MVVVHDKGEVFTADVAVTVVVGETFGRQGVAMGSSALFAVAVAPVEVSVVVLVRFEDSASTANFTNRGPLRSPTKRLRDVHA